MSSTLSFHDYQVESFFDEYFDESGQPKGEVRILIDRINALPDYDLQTRQEAIERALMRMGITFAVYGDQAGNEKIFPFDIVPRIISAIEWSHIEAGLKQRIKAQQEARAKMRDSLKRVAEEKRAAKLKEIEDRKKQREEAIENKN